MNLHMRRRARLIAAFGFQKFRVQTMKMFV